MSLQPQRQSQWGASSTSLVTSTLAQLDDALPHNIDSTLMDYLLIELVESFKESSAVASTRFKKCEQELISAGLLPESVKKKKEPPSLQPEEEQALMTRLEFVGKHVGGNLSERLTRDRPCFSDNLDAIKFVCKDVWIACWGKQVDNLRTNHRGVYIIQDNSFRPIIRISSWESQQETLNCARIHIAFALGVIKGVIQKLGLSGTVTADLTNPPHCGFQIKLAK